MNTQTARELFHQHGAIYVKDVVNEKICYFLTHYMLREEAELNLNKIRGKKDLRFEEGRGDIVCNDSQVPTAVAVGGSPIFDTLNEMVWPFLEAILGEELIPTYSYARLYRTGDRLEPHTDRPSCDISITIQLGRSHHYTWPIWAGSHRFDLAEGDGMLYKGCEIQHYREMCGGPPNYYSGQVFLHYVRANGPHAKWAGDQRWQGEINFKRLRNYDMEVK